MSEEETIKYRDAFPKDYDLPTYFTSKHAVSMSLRDYLAAKAMQAIMGDSRYVGVIGVNNYQYRTAEDAYKMADAMLVAREKA